MVHTGEDRQVTVDVLIKAMSKNPSITYDKLSPSERSAPGRYTHRRHPTISPTPTQAAPPVALLNSPGRLLPTQVIFNPDTAKIHS